MSDLLEKQRSLFVEALKDNYKACVFDIDGTLTDTTANAIPPALLDKLSLLSKNGYCALCTGRRFGRAYEILENLLEERPELKRNWFFICENGSIGYRYDIKNDQYIELYRIDYPYGEDHRKRLIDELSKALKGVMKQIHVAEVALAVSSKSRWQGSKDIVKQECDEMVARTIPVLKKMDTEKLLVVCNAGNTINILHKDGNKDYGVKSLYNFLVQQKVMKNHNQIVCIGDQGQPGGNDEAFLSGSCGTSFTVGNGHPLNEIPLPVFDNKGNIVFGPNATLNLISRLQFV
ncbi:HAD-IIB family hydrolase [Candidatus Peregrinibacteria bacterium]|nr:HAD-IIB family hydrolase [Candidatus Peregrinibacteria bacterium]